MNVVDTSAWLEFFTDGDNAEVFLAPITDTQHLIIPSICIYEITKVVLRESDEDHLLPIWAAMQKGKIIELSATLSTIAAKISLKYQLPMADSIIYATAQQYKATVWTQDVDFEKLPDVRYVAKKYH